MCGILGVLRKKDLSVFNVIDATSIIAHRGPDDEGLLLYNTSSGVMSSFKTPGSSALLNENPALRPWHHAADAAWQVALTHRRLSILDLSTNGHQPMILQSASIAVCFNGEIFNYVELREELRKKGHQFYTNTDTEVILHAWSEWGIDCLNRFNGMFAFLLLDCRTNELYAVRDRFGVKPLYYSSVEDYTVFASEAKQIRCLPGFRFGVNEKVALDYLQSSQLDANENTFDKDIIQLDGGTFLKLDLLSGKLEKKRWYSLKQVTFTGSFTDACDQFLVNC